MGILHGTIIDSATGQPISAKVHVLSARGSFCKPADAMLKRGPGTEFFFCEGEFEIYAQRGRTDVLVERGTEYEPQRVVVDVPAQGAKDIEIQLKRWYHPQEANWYPGNTHIHYDEKEMRPDDRLAIDSSVRGLQRHRRQRPRSSAASLRQQQISHRCDERIHDRPPRPRHR